MQKSIRISVMFIRSALINGMCLFEASSRKATSVFAPNLTVVQVSQRVLFFSLANEWHNERTIPFYVSAKCLARERQTIL